jgi:hypothetical protein
MGNATLRLTGTGGIVLGNLTVGGALTSSQIRSAGGIGKATVGAVASSNIFAGVADSIIALPTSASDLVTDAAIQSLTIKGSFSDSDIAGANLGKITIKTVNGGDGGKPFGVAAKSIGSITAPPIKWTSKLSPTLLTPNQDFVVRLLT